VGLREDVVFSVSVGRRNETAENVQHIPNVTNVWTKQLHLSYICSHSWFNINELRLSRELVITSEVQYVTFLWFSLLMLLFWILSFSYCAEF